MAKRGAGAQMAMGTVTSGFHLRLSDCTWRAMGPRGEKSGKAANPDKARRDAQAALAELRRKDDDK